MTLGLQLITGTAIAAGYMVLAHLITLIVTYIKPVDIQATGAIFLGSLFLVILVGTIIQLAYASGGQVTELEERVAYLEEVDFAHKEIIAQLEGR